jgi:diaminopimelate epimerase
MCGNGIRCFAKYAVERGLVRAGGPVRVETLAGIRTVAPRMEGGKVVRARVGMGEPRLDPDEVPVVLPEEVGDRIRGGVVDYPVEIGSTDLKLSFVSMGNPHAVAFLEDRVEEFPLHILGPQVENHFMFPRRVNFEIVNLATQGRLRARVWERGSGETMACGTGACAIAVASRLLGRTGDDVDITLPGGTLRISWDGEGEVYLEGDAVEVFQGEWRSP